MRKTLLIFKSVNEALANPTVNRWEFEYQFTMIKEIVHIIDRGLIIRDVTGKATRMVGAMTDITSKTIDTAIKRTQQNLKLHAAELERSMKNWSNLPSLPHMIYKNHCV
jgi:hypothetical protein